MGEWRTDLKEATASDVILLAYPNQVAGWLPRGALPDGPAGGGK